MKNRGLLIWFGFIMLGCLPADKTSDIVYNDTLKYAKGFSISHEGNNIRVTINRPYSGAEKGYSYLLVPRGEPVPEHDAAEQVIQIPIERIVCTSTTHIPLLDYLNESDALVGFPTTDYVSSAVMRNRIDKGEVTDVGIDKGMNLELLISLKPELVMSYTMTSDLGQLKKIAELGIPVVINAEYLEEHPLGRAEWIKFMALFFGKERGADSVFNSIEQEYLATEQLAASATTRPAAMSGIVYGDTWFMPAGKNYAAKLLHDAGIKYLWSETETSGFLELSFEAVYEKAKEADLWIGVGSFASLAELKAAEKRYTLFKPFQQGTVYSYNARMGAKGGSEFLELGYLRPDLILKDLVKIAHPNLLPDHALFFHKKLD
ncbi:MAG: periplasmic binding protein [Bacteroidetes bacterium OLB12]|nr:MAG: periplasmic binding protein [Bacteroidetes bacterium OLB12]HNR73525.1 ABC transporter substrate-binding protein [Cyclobacteriaceae bacterium]HNU41702.1 ABC transporter substrate-binding protein [Cyclobacteriaceae bacterium]